MQRQSTFAYLLALILRLFFFRRRTRFFLHLALILEKKKRGRIKAGVDNVSFALPLDQYQFPTVKTMFMRKAWELTFFLFFLEMRWMKEGWSAGGEWASFVCGTADSAPLKARLPYSEIRTTKLRHAPIVLVTFDANPSPTFSSSCQSQLRQNKSMSFAFYIMINAH